ncbi:MAG TPA: ABC transporter permease [Blastocatellia bacterium]|nr:ABC transporter permease [Blastocatellia bacterium]
MILDGLSQDLRLAYRALFRRPGPTIAAVLTLALGIGVTVSVFTFFSAVLIRPLPFERPRDLVQIWKTTLNPPSNQNIFSLEEFEALTTSHSLAGIAAYVNAKPVIGRGVTSEQVNAAYVSPSLFATLRVPPAVGRAFSEEDGKAGAAPTVVISHSLSKRLFPSEADPLGQSLTLDDKVYTVIGVMPPTFEFPLSADVVQLWMPLGAFFAGRGPRVSSLYVVGRLKPGMPIAEAQTELSQIESRSRGGAPQPGNEFGTRLVALSEAVSGDAKPLLGLLLAATCMLLGIASANVANLQLARGAARLRDQGIRIALGATRLRILRERTAEAFLLAITSAALALIIAQLSLDYLKRLTPNIPRIKDASIEWRVLVFAILVAVFVTFIMALVAAVAPRSLGTTQALKSEGVGLTRRRTPVGSLFLVLEVAFALPLLVGAGLTIDSLYRLSRVELGFTPKGVFAMTVSTSPGEVRQRAKLTSLYGEILERIRALPGVTSAGVSSIRPLTGGGVTESFKSARAVEADASSPNWAWRSAISEQYFSTVGTQMIEGREFTSADHATGNALAVINQEMARRYWPNINPVGERLSVEGGLTYEIVGVAGNARNSLDAQPEPHMYIPYWQGPPSGSLSILVKTPTSAAVLAPSLRSAVASVDPNRAVASMRGMEDYVDDWLVSYRFRASLFAVFGGLAVVLTALGLYSVMSFFVTQRTTEIGVRMALGSQAGSVVLLVMARGMKIASIGVVFGLFAAVAMGRLLSRFLFGVSNSDPKIFVGATLLAILVCVAAAYLPARKAATIDPLKALRYE